MYIYIYIQDPDLLIITVLADGLAPNGARPSVGTMLTEKLDMFPFKFLRLSMITAHHLQSSYEISVKLV